MGVVKDEVSFLPGEGNSAKGEGTGARRFPAIGPRGTKVNWHWGLGPEEAGPMQEVRPGGWIQMALSGRLRKWDLEMCPDGNGQRRGEGFSVGKCVFYRAFSPVWRTER